MSPPAAGNRSAAAAASVHDDTAATTADENVHLRTMSASTTLEKILERSEVLLIGPPHRPRQERRHQLRKAARRPSIAQSHASSAIFGRLPGVGRFHGERPLRGPHHETLTGYVLDDLVGVGEPPAEKLSDERDERADGDRPRGLPLHRLDVDVPRR